MIELWNNLFISEERSLNLLYLRLTYKHKENRKLYQGQTTIWIVWCNNYDLILAAWYYIYNLFKMFIADYVIKRSYKDIITLSWIQPKDRLIAFIMCNPVDNTKTNHKSFFFRSSSLPNRLHRPRTGQRKKVWKIVQRETQFLQSELKFWGSSSLPRSRSFCSIVSKEIRALKQNESEIYINRYRRIIQLYDKM